MTKVSVFSYDNNDVPSGYKCSSCGIDNVKLWRQYNTMVSDLQLLCVDCARKDQDVEYEVNESGYHKSDCGDCDQIEWLVPAVPVEDGSTYWGYTSVPTDGYLWWKQLPLR